MYNFCHLYYEEDNEGLYNMMHFNNSLPSKHRSDDWQCSSLTPSGYISKNYRFFYFHWCITLLTSTSRFLIRLSAPSVDLAVARIGKWPFLRGKSK